MQAAQDKPGRLMGPARQLAQEATCLAYERTVVRAAETCTKQTRGRLDDAEGDAAYSQKGDAHSAEQQTIRVARQSLRTH